MLRHLKCSFVHFEKVQISILHYLSLNFQYIPYFSMKTLKILHMPYQWYGSTLIKISEKNLENWRFYNKNLKHDYFTICLKLRSWLMGLSIGAFSHHFWPPLRIDLQLLTIGHSNVIPWDDVEKNFMRKFQL